VIPARVTDELLSILQQSRFQIVMVMHCNHANEIDESVQQAFAALHSVSHALYNQAVLLKGVNDNLEALKPIYLLDF